MTGEQSTDDGELVRAVREGGVTVVARLRAAVGGEVGLRCELESSEPLSAAARAAISDRISFFLGLDDDLTEFYRLATDDPPFRAVVERLYGYHQVKFPSPLELLCWAILAQRTPMPVARKMKRALVAECGNVVLSGGREMWAFPDLEQLLTLSSERFRELIGNERKASYLHRGLRVWARLDEGFLRTAPHEEVRERLLEIPGVGQWSAAFIMIRGLGRMERISPDKEMSRAVARVYGRAVTEADFEALADRYGSWRGYWGHYLRVGG